MKITFCFLSGTRGRTFLPDFRLDKGIFSYSGTFNSAQCNIHTVFISPGRKRVQTIGFTNFPNMVVSDIDGVMHFLLSVYATLLKPFRFGIY